MSALRTRTGDQLSRVRRRGDTRPAALLGIVVLALLVLQPDAVSNYSITLQRIADTGIVALGLTPLLVLGEIDLSVGATMGLAGIVAAKITGSPWLAFGAAIGAAAAIGCINAFLVLVVRVTSFIATLGTMIALQGVALAVSSQAPVSFSNTNLVLKANEQLVGPLIPGVVLMFICALLLQGFLAHTRPGRDLYAIGGNPVAAIAANIPSTRRTWGAFVGCSILAALAGLVDAVTQATADPNVGTTVLLTAVTAAVLGGAELTGGRGSASGTLMAALAVGGISTGLELGGVNSNIENVVIGGILFVAIVSNPEGGQRLRQLSSTLTPRRQRE